MFAPSAVEVGAVAKTGVMVRVKPSVESAPMAFGVPAVSVPFEATRFAKNCVVVSVTGLLNVIVRTPVDVAKPGVWFDAEVANNAA